jgi:hypothetical protein
MENEKLTISYEVNSLQFRKIWLDLFKRGLPRLFAFSGIAFLVWILLLSRLDDLYLGILLAMAYFSIPILIILFNYIQFTKSAKDNFALLNENEKIIHLSFERGADGFDCVYGKNFTHTAWESIKSVKELDDCFVFVRAGNMFYVPKTAFQDQTEIGFLRFLIRANVNKNVKLLE